MVLGGAWVALSGCEGGGRCGSAGLALPGQECIGLRLKREVTINMLLGGSCVMRAAVAMSLQGGRVVDDTTRGGGVGQCEASSTLQSRTTTMGEIFPHPPPLAVRRQMP
jgi:hypothetical protein